MRCYPEGMLRGLLFTVASALFGLAVACGPSRNAHVRARNVDDAGACRLAHGELQKGIAEQPTWVTVDGFDARVRMPSGWQFAKQGSTIVGNGKHSEWVLAGSCSRDEAVATLLRIGRELGVQVGAAGSVDTREVMLGGLHATRQDFSSVLVAGKPAHSIALVADAPTGSGYVVFLGYALDGHDDASHDLASALDSLTTR